MKKQVLLLTITTIPLLSALSVAEDDPNQFDSLNAAHWYRKAFAVYQEPNSVDALRDYATGEADMTPDLEKYLQSQEQVIEIVSRATSLEKCDWQYDRFRDIWEGINDYSRDAVRCGVIVLAEARYTETGTLPTQTFEKFHIALRVAEHINFPHSWDHMNHLLLKGCCYSALQAYLNRHPDLSPEDLSQLQEVLLEDSRRKEITLNEILDDRLEFARVALTQHTDQYSRDENDAVSRIIDYKGQDGWKEFFEKSLSFYTAHMNNLRTAVNTPLMHSWVLRQIEAEFDKEAEAFLEKYTSLPDDFVPTKQDYDQYIEKCGLLFATLKDMPLNFADRCIMGFYTRRNALITAVDLLKRYHRTGVLPSQIPDGSPRDRFGNQPFQLIKTQDGFILKSQSQNVYKEEYPEYTFKLPAK